MADWFKFYENDLDDERLQWAMSEQPHTAIVYIRLMSRCCRDKVRTLSWEDEELELFALAGTLHISVPIVNQCIGLLKRIGYIEIISGECNLLRWSERQSEYCKKRERGVRTISGQCQDSVRTVSSPSPLLSSPLISSEEGNCKGGETPDAGGPTWDEFWKYIQQLCPSVDQNFAKDKWLKEESAVPPWGKVGNWWKYAERVIGWWSSNGQPKTHTKKPYSPNI